jgi:CBS domain-containing protein
MTQPAQVCHPASNLAEVAMKMYDGDLGAVPVVDESAHLVGMITDRDICIALATRHRRAEELTAADVMRRDVFSVEPHQDVREAMRLMAREQIRRLPVLGEDGRVKGVLSVNDLVMGIRSRARSGSEPTTHEVLELLQAIGAHPRTLSLQVPASPQKVAL